MAEDIKFNPPELSIDELRAAVAQVSYHTTGALLMMRITLRGMPGWAEAETKQKDKMEAFSNSIDKLIDLAATLTGIQIDG